MNGLAHPQDTEQRAAAHEEGMASSVNLLQELRQHRRQRGWFSNASWSSAWEAIWTHRGRSFLTLLSIIIGMVSVISVLTMTDGVNTYENDLVAQSLGANTILVQGLVPQNQTVVVNQLPQPFSLRDWQSLQKVPHITALSPGNTGEAQAIYGNRHWGTQISGASLAIQSIENLQIAEGSWYSDAQEANPAPVGWLESRS